MPRKKSSCRMAAAFLFPDGPPRPVSSFFYPKTSIITPPVTASQRCAVMSAVGSTVTDRWAGFSRSNARSRAGMSAGTRPAPTASAVTCQLAKSSSTSPLSPPPSVTPVSYTHLTLPTIA